MVDHKFRIPHSEMGESNLPLFLHYSVFQIVISSAYRLQKCLHDRLTPQSTQLTRKTEYVGDNTISDS